MTHDDLTGAKPAEVRAAIIEWLTPEDWKLEEMPAPEAQWALQAQRKDTPTIIVGLLKKPSDLVLIQASLTIDPQTIGTFSRLPDPTRAQILSQVKINLLLLRLDYTNLTDPPGTIQLTTKVYLSGLTKNYFFEHFTAVKNGIYITVASFTQGFAAPAATTPGPARPIH